MRRRYSRSTIWRVDERENKCLDAIVCSLKATGKSPTLDEICEATRLNKSAVIAATKGLEGRGEIVRCGNGIHAPFTTPIALSAVMALYANIQCP